MVLVVLVVLVVLAVPVVVVVLVLMLMVLQDVGRLRSVQKALQRQQGLGGRHGDVEDDESEDLECAGAIPTLGES